MYQLVCGFAFVVFLAVFQINGRVGCKDQLKRTQETLEIKEKQIQSLEAKEEISKEKQKLWDLMAQIWPAYNDYQSRTSREIPVVILECL